MIDGKSLAVLLSCMGSIGFLSWLRAQSRSLAEEDVLDMDYNDFAKKELAKYKYTSFETTGGSKYGVGNRQVTALRIGGSTKRGGAAAASSTDPNAGKQSLITYYVRPSDAKRLGLHLLGQREKNNFLLITAGAIYAVSKSGSGGVTAEGADWRNPIMFTTYPTVNTCPVELWDEGEIDGRPTYRSWHAGSPINKVMVAK